MRPLARLAPFVALFALWLLFFWRYFIPGPDRVAFPDGDFTRQFFIFRDIAYRALAQGRLPLWADCFFGGYPFHADPQSQLFYPPIWISFALLKLMGWGHFPLFALTLEAALHYLLAGLLAFAFLRAELARLQPSSLNPQPFALPALLGAIAFTYGGYLTGYPPLQTAILETATWLPLSLIAFRRLADSPPGLRHWLGAASAAALGLALAFFAGHPQTFLFVGYLSAAYFIHRAGIGNLSWRDSLTRLGAALTILLGLSAVQLLPQIQFLGLSTRAALNYDQLATGFPLGVIVHLLFTDNVWSPLFIGVLPLALSLLALASALGLARQPAELRRTVFFWGGVALAGLALSFGGNAAAYPAAYWLAPGFRLFRGQERAALLVSFALAVLAALGAALALSPRHRALRLLTRRAARAALGLLPPALFGAVALGALRAAYPEPAALATLPERLIGLALGLGLAAAALFAAARFASPAAGAGVGFLCVGFVAFELFTAAAPSNRVAPFDPYPYLPILDPIRNDPDPFFRVQADSPTMPGHFGCGYGLAEWGGISPIRLASWEAFEAGAPESLRWKLLGVKYLITWKNGAITREGELPPAERVAEGPAPLGEAKVYRLFDLPRRAWVVAHTQNVVDSEALFARLRARDFDPFAAAVILGAQPALAGPGPLASVETVADRPGHLAFAVASDAPGLLIVSEAYYPGWAAAVNGQPAAVVQADGLVMAVPIPAGNASVELNYRPPLLMVGAALSAIALLACLFLVIAQYRRPGTPNP